MTTINDRTTHAWSHSHSQPNSLGSFR